MIFTEHRDTLNYLVSRIVTLLGREECIVQIHGGLGREQRRAAQESFLHDPDVQILIATDAAGEGINLQRAHLMVNYDLPWNPNRIEQRFGRIHRIGQTEVCHLWNLVADGTREGDVFRRLLEKLENARSALGGQVFDVLGQLEFSGRSLRELLIEAIRYGDRPEVRMRLAESVGKAVDRDHIQSLIEEHVLVHDVMDTSRVARARTDLERANVKRLQPHFIESFFLEALRTLGGTVRQREPRRYQISHVPTAVRELSGQLHMRDSVLPRYERIAFEKSLISIVNKPTAAFVCPGHPLLTSVLHLSLERYGAVLKQGTVLVDDKDGSSTPRVLFVLEHEVQDAGSVSGGTPRVISKRMLYIELDGEGNSRQIGFAPYLDYRPLGQDDPPVETILALPELIGFDRHLEQQAQTEAIATLVPDHLSEVRSRRRESVKKTRMAVKDRLTKEIAHWYNRAEGLLLQERAQRSGARLNSGEARRRAIDLEERLARRMSQLDRDEQVSASPPTVLSGAVVVPAGLIARLTGVTLKHALNTQETAERARKAVMKVEQELGFTPVDKEFERIGIRY